LKTSSIGFAVLGCLLLGAIVVSLGLGPVKIGPERVMEILWHRSGPGTDVTIVWDLRLPRILLACLIGAGLGTAGAGYQGLFRNPLADPYVIGASSGAALGATLAIIGGMQTSLWGLGAISLAALAGALLSVGLVYTIASAGRQSPTMSLLLAGATVSNLFGAAVSLLMFLNDEKLAAIFGWLMGSLSARGWPVLSLAAPPVLGGALLLWLLSRSLDGLTFGEETASSLGMPIIRVRAAVVVASSLTTAAAVAAVGVIGFVGLIAPHSARFLFGARHSRLIPASALIGAISLVIADDLARTLASAELPIGVLTALLGSPFFLALLMRRRGEPGVGP